MKLLFLTPQLPYPPHQGTTLRNYNILRVLAPRHEIHLLSFGVTAQLLGSPLNELCARIEIAAPPSRSMTRRAFETLFQPLPDMARRLASPELARKFAALVRETAYDVVQIEGIEMANFWLQAGGSTLKGSASSSAGTRGHGSTGVLVHQKQTVFVAESDRKNPHSLQPPTILFDDHNAEWTLQHSAYETDRRRPRRWHAALYSWIQFNKLKRFEREVCLAADAVVAVSAQDAEAIAALDPRIQPIVIPNGVDVEAYVPSDEVCAKPLAELGVVFTGKMDFRPNIDAAVWFADEILPLLRHEIPLAHVSFVGQKPSPQVLALRARPGVAVTGFVPDTRPYIADAAVYAVPLRMGSGTRLKVLEALAMGKAIVSTSLGVAGIECQNGRDLLIADTAPEFARALASLLRDKSRARELGMNARRLAQERYDWRKLVPKFEEIYMEKSL